MKIRKVDLATTRTPLDDFVGQTAIVKTEERGLTLGTLERHPYNSATLAVRFDDGRWAGTGHLVDVVVA